VVLLSVVTTNLPRREAVSHFDSETDLTQSPLG